MRDYDLGMFFLNNFALHSAICSFMNRSNNFDEFWYRNRKDLVVDMGWF